MDDGVVVRLGPILRVVGDVGRRLALVDHSIRREDGARLATMPTARKPTRWLEIMANRKLDSIKESLYPCFCVFVKAVSVLVVGESSHHQTQFLASVVRLIPLGRSPPLHHIFPALKMRDRPVMNHLQKTSTQHIRR
jgi:hypothetical protein